MIKCDFNGVECNGSKIMLIADVTTIMHHLLEKEIVTADELIDAVELAQKSEEEVAKEVDDLMDKRPEYRVLDMLFNVLPHDVVDRVLCGNDSDD